MQKKFILLFSLLTLVVVVLFFTNDNTRLTSVDQKVATTIFPLYDITRNIAGNSIEVVLILPTGASPHTFEPTPQEIKALQGSNAIFSIGHEVDNWSIKLAKTAGIGKQITVDENIDLIEGNPHYWLSVKNAVLIADQVTSELSDLYPEYQDLFKRNSEAYKAKLTNLDKDIKSQIGDKQIQIATFHEAWDYFAQDYDIEVVASFEEYPGKEPSPAYLANFQKEIRSSSVKVIFAEPQFSTAQLIPIATDLGIQISTLDPIGGVEGRDSYESTMRYNLERILQQ